jgi:hypothetical protein
MHGFTDEYSPKSAPQCGMSGIGDFSERLSVPFTPRSIMEHAAALGGWIHVARQGFEATVVVIEIPL